MLFIDIVGYSKLVTSEQRRLLELLNQIVRESEHFRLAEAKHRLLTVPTGDGMALVFYNTPEAPVESALEISSAASEHSELQLRMGIHSGPVSGVVDVSGRSNIAGAGINIAQRVMDCGDSGHILVSKHMAEDLEQYGHWKQRLHDLGECEVKHGVRVSVVNLYTEDHGNPEVPQKFVQARHKAAAVPFAAKTRRTSRSWIIAVAVIIVAALAVGGYFLSRRSGPVAGSTAQSQAPAASASTVSSAAPAVASGTEKSIAVLPFENLSSDKENAFFTDGVQDEILTDLAKIADLKVISRTSVMQYKTGAQRNLREIGQQLGVAHLVEGSVQKVANRVRVNAQLINARNDAHLWAQTYDRDLADVFAIQSEIAKAIADQLQAKLSPAEKNAIEQRPTSDIAAFELYSRAKDLILNTWLQFAYRCRISVQGSICSIKPWPAIPPSSQRSASSRTHTICFTLFVIILLNGAPWPTLRSRQRSGYALMLAKPISRAPIIFTRAYRDYDGALAELEIARSTMPNAPRIFELTGLSSHGGEARTMRDCAICSARWNWILATSSLFSSSHSAISFCVAMLKRLPRWTAHYRSNQMIPRPRQREASLYFDWKADTRPLHQTIDEIRSKNPEAVKSVADVWFICALAERDAAAADMALKRPRRCDVWR